MAGERAWTFVTGAVALLVAVGLAGDAGTFSSWGYEDVSRWMWIAAVTCLVCGLTTVGLGVWARRAPFRFAATGTALVVAGLSVPLAQVGGGYEWVARGEDLGTDRAVIYDLASMLLLIVGGFRLGRAARQRATLGVLAAAAALAALVIALLPTDITNGSDVALRWVALVVLVVAEGIGLARPGPTTT